VPGARQVRGHDAGLGESVRRVGRRQDDVLAEEHSGGPEVHPIDGGLAAQIEKVFHRRHGVHVRRRDFRERQKKHHLHRKR